MGLIVLVYLTPLHFILFSDAVGHQEYVSSVMDGWMSMSME
jgi:hypothetical protein